ncbi:MAG: translation initiation factor IF-2 [Solobacterium sp.]|jgi:translation initiation factor IF-2|nr:translation initiation factor IF-2 [Solobacterium sp.]MCH4222531.1 translation initiation factor IF-2 [Solobacterium sp.]MCH4265316.1 translation initiation factor IF-2 [Solobacterium sp.]
MPVKRKPGGARRPQKRKNNNRNAQNTNRSYTPVNNKKVPDIHAITYSEGISVGELAKKCGRNSSDIIKVLFMDGKMVTINSTLDDSMVETVCLEYDIEPTKVKEHDEDSLVDDDEIDDPKLLKERPPIVTVMGHVDHGKTTLLDAIRKTKVAAGEAGGITQAIGAYQVTVGKRKVTFLDTPGHEAFTAMRARGAKVTDLAVIVVAADDGVMPQTREAIDHAKAADVPMIIAINKIDKPGANPDRVKNELAELGIMPEEWGGDTIFVETSAKKGTGIKELLETILTVADVKELKANPKRLATGTVIEAKLDKGRGPVATLLIQNGTLHHGDPVVVGSCFGKIRRMTDEDGRELKSAGPSSPVEVIGLNDVPEAGDLFRDFDNEREARAVADRRSRKKIEANRRHTSAMSLEDLSKQIEAGEIQEIPVIIKADVQGSAEAVRSALEKLDVKGVKLNVIHSTAGAISESDIMLADASKAMIIGFNVRPDAAIRKKAEDAGVEIRLHDIIYKVTEEMENAMKGMLAPVYTEVVIGQAEVTQTYKVSKIGTIGGCKVTDGKLVANCGIRLIREGIVVYTGKLGSLKRFKDDAKEVNTGYECGITIENYNDIKVGDTIEAYQEQEVPQEA